MWPLFHLYSAFVIARTTTTRGKRVVGLMYTHWSCNCALWKKTYNVEIEYYNVTVRMASKRALCSPSLWPRHNGHNAPLTVQHSQHCASDRFSAQGLQFASIEETVRIVEPQIIPLFSNVATVNPYWQYGLCIRGEGQTNLMTSINAIILSSDAMAIDTKLNSVEEGRIQSPRLLHYIYCRSHFDVYIIHRKQTTCCRVQHVSSLFIDA